MISGINSTGLFGGGWNSLAAMNDFKLAQILSNKSTASSAVKPVQKPGATLSKDAAAFLNDYKDNLTELDQLAKNLMDTNSKGVLNAMSASSSDGAVLTAQSKSPAASPGSYQVDVRQLAQSQVNLTEAVSAGAVPVSGGSLVLDTSEGSFEFSVDPGAAGSNKELLSAIADAINEQKAGVTAFVTEKDGQISLSVAGNQTGKENAFRISGSFAEQTGLANAAQQAQDAAYTLDKGDGKGAVEYTSATNKVSVDAGRIEATLKNTGKAEIKVGPDPNAIADGVSKLVNQFNKTVQFLEKNSDRGIGVLKQLRNMASPPTGVKAMQLVGISAKADGTYTFDRAKFLDSMSKNPTLTRDVVGGSFGVANGMREDARKGMNASSASLVGQQPSSLAASDNQLLYQQSPITMLNAYNRNGIYNMMNYYAVGSLMNFRV